MMRLLPLLLVPLILAPDASAQRKRRPRPTEQTLACGSEIPWVATLEEALATAKTEKRPVLWYVPTVRGSRMDRKPEIDHYMMSGPYSDPDVASVITRKFVPVKLVARGEAQNKYGLVHGKFIEPGFLILTPAGEEVFRVDKITTLSSEWWVWQLRNALSRCGGLNRPSPQAAAAAKGGDQMALAEALLAEGDLDGAGKAANALAKVGRLAPEAGILIARVARRRHDADTARRWLSGLQDHDRWPRALVEQMRLELGLGRADACAAAYLKASKPSDEARFLYGAALHHLNRDGEGRAAWQGLLEKGGNNRWTHKASAELQRLGPFVRSFERFEWLPDDAYLTDPDGTRVPRKLDRSSWLARKSVELLLVNQRDHGGWDDSNYDFGGTDSLPNVYVSGTALAAIGLMEWRDIDPKRIDKAIDKALTYLLDERNVATKDRNEIVWAHAYRLIFFEHYLRYAGVKRLKGPMDARTKAIEVVKALSDLQLESGAWRHEYPNPFATASVVHALFRIKDAKVPTGKKIVDKATAALATTRGDDGTFSYGMPGRRGRGRSRGSAVEGAAGRMPTCELALLMAGQSDQKRLRHALDVSFEHHGLLEAIRKYDDHADRYGNGGFFFWYDLYGRTEAIQRVKNTAARETYRKKMLQLVLDLPEIDGGFVDSHELGKTYGTAMALICLKAALPTGQ